MEVPSRADQLPNLRPITFDDMPPAAVAAIAEAMPMQLPLSANAACSDPVEFDHGPDKTYALRYEAMVGDDEGGQHPETELVLVDMQDDATPLGVGIVTREQVPAAPEDTVPYVGWTQTRPDARGKGLGLRRLRIMNELSLSAFGQPLHSSLYVNAIPEFQPTPEAQRLWARLVAEGVAEPVAIGDKNVFRFRV
ncbi:MAG TPA: hypothetical protein VF466_04125 [Candidatus Saccharimonadales bacterium]